MAKTNSILKKAELFEKLSLYGKRSDFLRALAADMAEAFPAEGLVNTLNTVYSSCMGLSSTNPDLDNTIKTKAGQLKQLFSSAVATTTEAADQKSSSMFGVLKELKFSLSLLGKETGAYEPSKPISQAVQSVDMSMGMITRFRTQNGLTSIDTTTTTPAPTPKKNPIQEELNSYIFMLNDAILKTNMIGITTYIPTVISKINSISSKPELTDKTELLIASRKLESIYNKLVPLAEKDVYSPKGVQLNELMKQLKPSINAALKSIGQQEMSQGRTGPSAELENAMKEDVSGHQRFMDSIKPE